MSEATDSEAADTEAAGAEVADPEMVGDGPPDPVLRLARRVVGTPIERDGVVLVPVAVVSGGSGGGSGTDAQGNLGQGAGWGGTARPVGAYVLAEGRVRYEPVIDVARIVLGAQLAGTVAVLVLGRWLRARS